MAERKGEFLAYIRVRADFSAWVSLFDPISRHMSHLRKVGHGVTERRLRRKGRSSHQLRRPRQPNETKMSPKVSFQSGTFRANGTWGMPHLMPKSGAFWGIGQTLSETDYAYDANQRLSGITVNGQSFVIGAYKTGRL